MDSNFLNDKRLKNLESFKSDILDFIPFCDKNSGKLIGKYKNYEEQISKVSEETTKALVKHISGDLKMYTDSAI